MGVLRSTQSMEAEVEEMRASLLLPPLRRPGAGPPAWGRSGAGSGGAAAKRAQGAEEGAAEARDVCVTGGISFVGLAVVDRLLRHGYTVRLALETQGKFLSSFFLLLFFLPLPLRQLNWVFFSFF